MNSFIAFVQRLQQKPVNQKRMIVLGSSLFLTGIIFIVWITTLSLFPSSLSANEVADTSAGSPASSFGQNLSLVITSIKSMWSGNSEPAPIAPAPAITPDVTPTMMPTSEDEVQPAAMPQDAEDATGAADTSGSPSGYDDPSSVDTSADANINPETDPSAYSSDNQYPTNNPQMPSQNY